MLSNFDLFVEFYQKVKDSEDIAEVLKEYGGSSIYVPSYKSTYRNADILDEYEQSIKDGKSSTAAIREIAAKHNLSYNSVSAIIRELKEPALF
ncbi:DNA-binding protein [Campylobacter sp. RM12920]|uniref:DNA-binding protein n=1 Tax=Campylobacter californiensis TaxID=1032243 RepID=A0ABD4JJE9_9BACT|nr:DNA-binding protein [Campylobacter sp. RM12919]MBE2988981.1 DNA-binding protein [Campylobacter sp. RM12920]